MVIEITVNPIKNRSKFVKKDKLIKTCGGISLFTKKLLENLGIPTRLILFLTLQPWNNYDNGHTCIEVFWENEWKLIDIDLKQTIKVNNQEIRAIDFPRVIKSKNYELFKLSEAPVVSRYSKVKGYNYSLLTEAMLSSKNRIKDWYARCADVVIIYESGYWWFHHPEKDRVLKYNPNFQYLEKNDFESKFYFET